MSQNPTLISQLEVYKDELYVGLLRRTTQGSRFEFSKELIEDPHRRKITYRIQAQQTPLEVVGVNLPPYFAGLLPEGLRLKALIKRTKTSQDDLFSLLAGSGTEPVGDLHFKIPGNSQKETQKFEPQLMDDFARLRKEILQTGENLNHPVSGVQDKISGSRLTLPLKVGIKSKTQQFILKFDSQETPDLVENEWHSLKLAKACGLQVSQAKVITDSQGEKALLVTRFDRQWVPEEKRFQRYHQEDACQFLDRYPADKYLLSFQEIADGLQSYCESPQIEILNLLRLAAFSYLLGNGDLHGKNISLLQKSVSTLSPAYDMVCTYAYGDLQMALALDGKKDNWKRKLLVAFGERYGVPAISTEKMLDQLAKKFAQNRSLLWKVPYLNKKKKSLEPLFSKRLDHLGM